MKFFGEPNKFVVFISPELKRNNKIGFRFNENGEYETTNKRLIQALKRKFKYEDDNLPLEVKIDTVEANVVENNDIVEEEKEVAEEVKVVKRSKKGGK